MNYSSKCIGRTWTAVRNATLLTHNLTKKFKAFTVNGDVNLQGSRARIIRKSTPVPLASAFNLLTAFLCPP